MSRQDLFERILASLHAGVLDDARWPAISALIDEACESKGNMLVSGDGGVQDDVDIFFASLCYRGQRHLELEREYFEVYHGLDERMPRLRQLPDSRIVHVDELFSEEEKKRSVVYNEILGRSETGACVHVRLDGPDDSRIVWTVADPIDGDGWTSERVEMVERLLPHLRQYVRVRHALVGARALGASVIELLDNVRVGVIQLDRRARVRAANDRARALLRRGDGLWDEDGHLRASLPEEDTALQRLLAWALPSLGRPGVGGSMVVSRSGSLSRLVLHVGPVHGTRVKPGLGRIGALVLAVDPEDRTGIDPEQVREVLGLTRAESRVAVLLAQGKSIDDIALVTRRSRTTIKWHIRHIYAKHGLSRQIELAQLVTSLSDIPGVRG